MKKLRKHIIVTLAASLLASGGAFAQHNVYKGKLNFGTPKTALVSNDLIVDIDVDLTNLKLHKQQLLMLTPMLRLRQADESNTYIFAPVAINGKTRYEAFQRSMKFDNIYFEYEPGLIIKRENGRGQIIPLSVSVPYEPWMSRADLVFVEEVTGCANCHVAYNEYVLPMNGSAARRSAVPVTQPANLPVTAEQMAPSFVMSLVVPPAEKVKERKETYTSSLNFVVSRYDILRNFRNNKERLDMVDRIISNIKNDKNVQLTELKVVGYASPDGGFDSNLALSKKRALAFVEYLKKTHNLPEYMVDFRWEGEDWKTLREKVAESQMPEKEEVLYVIDNYGNINERKAIIRQMNYGETFFYLLGVYYPSLRRDVYTISYIAKNFDVAEAKTLIKTKPQQLSLNEMFLVASTYPVGSNEFKDVFVTASRYFPQDAVSNINVGAIEVENGNIDGAIRRLTGIERAEAWNNLGVAYVKKGDYKIAEQYFTKAANAGDATAKNNLQQLRSWMPR